MKRLGCVAVLIAGLMMTPAVAQQKATTGKFDGKYVGSMSCAGPTNARFNGLTIRQSKFSFTFTSGRGAGSISCALQIKPDGSFDNQSCSMPTTGKVVGDKIEFRFKAPEAICDVAMTRQGD